MLDEELLARIGEVTVETAKLEYAAARLVVALTQSSGDPTAAVAGLMRKPGAVRKRLEAAAVAHPEWRALSRFTRDFVAVVDDRHKIVHSVVIETLDEGGHSAVEFWHVPSNTRAAVTASAVLEHAFDVGRCFARAVRLIEIAESGSCGLDAD